MNALGRRLSAFGAPACGGAAALAAWASHGLARASARLAGLAAADAARR